MPETNDYEYRIPDTTEPPPEDQSIVTKPLHEVMKEEAERQGWWAYGFGFQSESNPYNVTPPQEEGPYDWWASGYWSAADEDEG